jgi:hypothetical protein
MIQHTPYDATKWHREDCKFRMDIYRSALAAPNARIEPHFLSSVKALNAVDLTGMKESIRHGPVFVR